MRFRNPSTCEREGTSRLFRSWYGELTAQLIEDPRIQVGFQSRMQLMRQGQNFLPNPWWNADDLNNAVSMVFHKCAESIKANGYRNDENGSGDCSRNIIEA